MPHAIRAVAVADTHKLALAPVDVAPAAADEVTVRVTAGVIEEVAPDGSGPSTGTRVVGFLQSGAWAEQVRVPVHAVAALPAGVTDAEAATLPVAGLTALHALRQGGLLLGRKVLVDGATGGVGHLAVQLGSAAGAHVYAQVRNPEQAHVVAPWCGDRIIVAPELSAAAGGGPYHLILDSIGGLALSAALTMLDPGGTCVTFGVSGSPTVTFESGLFFRQGGVSLYGLILFHELKSAPAGQDLALLASEIANGRLRPYIGIEAP